MAHHPAMYPDTAVSSDHFRPPSPPGPPPFSSVLDTKVEDFQILKIYPERNENRVLKLVVYNFLPKRELFLKNAFGRPDEKPTGAQIILIQGNGDGLALVQKREHGPTVFRALFTIPPYPKGIRSKVNVRSNEVKPLDPQEAWEVPCGTNLNDLYTKKRAGVIFKPKRNRSIRQKI
ncbi:uncharacterized protein LOC117172538 [Belonocnema kinseyi]|uniref:uncharacterized protein LOC117172538 n=1 Tax=Belonocnema kinseyi TaxID=2817044 RepID=UPI00143E0A6B|nr:uncharacterized protein LOC117172538 [Belonocnema kinseyi]